MGYEAIPKDIIEITLKVLFKKANKDKISYGPYDETFWEGVVVDSINQAVVRFKPDKNHLGANGFVGYAKKYCYRDERNKAWAKRKSDGKWFKDVTNKNSEKKDKTNGRNIKIANELLEKLCNHNPTTPESDVLKEETISLRKKSVTPIIDVLYEALEDQDLSPLHKDLICKEYGLMGESCHKRKDLMEIYEFTSHNLDYHRSQSKKKLGEIISQKICRVYPEKEQSILADYNGWGGKNKKKTERISEIYGVEMDEIGDIIKRAEESLKTVTDLFI